MMAPPDEVLAIYRVQVVAPLGGGLNRHWLVHRRGEPLVLRRWSQPRSDIDYELQLLAEIAALGWPVAPAVENPLEWDGQVWCLFLFLPGDPPSLENRVTEQRARGRLLAEFHADLAKLGDRGQRPGWRR